VVDDVVDRPVAVAHRPLIGEVALGVAQHGWDRTRGTGGQPIVRIPIAEDIRVVKERA
jgi:hypothetical protein